MDSRRQGIFTLILHYIKDDFPADAVISKGRGTVCVISALLTLGALCFFLWGTKEWTPE